MFKKIVTDHIVDQWPLTGFGVIRLLLRDVKLQQGSVAEQRNEEVIDLGEVAGLVVAVATDQVHHPRCRSS